MRAEYVNSFYKAIKEVFELMIDIVPQRSNMRMVDSLVSNKDANVILEVKGNLQGTILFSFPQDMILKMMKIMSGMDVDKIDSFASSALGEVANIIGGNALTNLAEQNYICDIAPPQIFVGEHKALSIVDEKALQLTLTTPIGEFDITISLNENQSE
ncbi:MAG: chemotaxis protein CheX [Clostridiales bacterium]|nr:chemotaxis protein CheX [Clostridiales bacterium]